MQIVIFDWNSMADDLDTEIADTTQPCFPQADAKDLPYGMWDKADEIIVDIGGYDKAYHPLQYEYWEILIYGDPNSGDSVLLTPEGEVIDRMTVYKSASVWYTDDVKDFILSNLP